MKELLVSKQKILLLSATIAAYALIFIDESGIAVTLPAIQKSFTLSINAVHWVINSYLLVLSIFLLLGGKLADKYGQRCIFLTGTIIFLIASIVCACAQNVFWLISGRLLQGIGASLLLPCISTLIKNYFPDEHFGKAFGFVVGFSNLFYALGPFVGGVLTEYLSWRWFFWINILIGLCCYLCAYYATDKRAGNNEKIEDHKGIISFMTFVTLLVLVLMQINQWGWSSLLTLSCVVGTILSLVYFINIEDKSGKPLLDLSLFYIRRFSLGNVILLLSSICLTLSVFLALYLERALGFSPAAVGLGLLPATLTFIFMPNLAGIWHDRSGARAPILVGGVLLLFSLVWLVLTASFHEYGLFFVGLLAFGVGIPLVIPNSIMTIMGAVNPEQSGMASGTFTTVRQLGLTLGIALFSAMGGFEAGLILFAVLALTLCILGFVGLKA